MRAKILIVDAEPSVRKFLQIGLTRAGYGFQSATTHEEAIGLCRAGTVDLMLADVGCPPIGHDLARAVAREQPRLRVVLMAAWHSECERCPFISGCCVIAKPFRMDSVVTTIEEVLTAPSPATYRAPG